MYKTCKLKTWSADDFNLTHTMLNYDAYHCENSVDPDQLASVKPADQDPYCFPLHL